MKQDYRIKIQLISDLCVSDGSVYNSAIDTDVCYDDNGFPYIPAKRIKGCLRECAMELKDWGISIDISGIFGKEGNKKSSLRLENAYLKDYGKYKEEVECAGGHVLVHPQNVLRCFTYVRSQTALDYETGVAEASSLRTMRVIKKGLEFIAPVKIEEKYKDELKKCCTIWKHMGIARTRGFGEISVCLEETEEVKGQKEHIKWTDGAERLVYQLELEEPVICKSVNGQEENTLDYIEGSKMLGFLAQNLKREKGNQGFYDYMNMGEVYCSNAYICENDQRLSEVPGTYYSIKNEEDKYVDKIYEKEANRKDVEKAGIQLNQMKHCYVGKDKEGKLIKRNVMVEERYHHRRPDDKSIGRAVEENAKGHETENRTQDSKFYQMSSIRQGQTFQGFIQGTKEQIEKAYSCLKGCDTMQIGYSRSAEYGKVRFRITELKPLKETERRTKQVVAILQAPAIIYNEKATYATNIKELEQEIAVELGIDGEYETTQSYVKYTTVGGFQVTWGRRKPTLEAFDKGTVVIFHLKEEKNLGIKDTYWIGERVQEGFGEMRVEIPDGKGTYENQLQKETAQTVENLELKEFTFLPEIARNLLESYMKVEAVKKAKKLVEEKKWKKNASCKPTINNMLSMCKECNCIKDIEDCIQERFGKISCNKPEKNKIATAILKQVKEEFEKGEIDVILLERFYQRFGLSPFYVEEKEIEKQEIKYLQFCLLEIKYALRRGDVEDGTGD